MTRAETGNYCIFVWPKVGKKEDWIRRDKVG